MSLRLGCVADDFTGATDLANHLVRVLQAQLRLGRAGLVVRRIMAQGAAALAVRMAALKAKGVTLAVVDAVDDADLHVLAEATHVLPLVVASSGLGIVLPRWNGSTPCAQAAALPAPRGSAAVVSGSCTAASSAQAARPQAPARRGFAWHSCGAARRSIRACPGAAPPWAPRSAARASISR